jgi:hypothetical protein
MTFPMEPYLALLLIGVLPSEIWRWLGILFGRGLREDSEIILWVRAVATALVAAVVARITLFPPGALAAVPAEVRVAALALGFLAFLLFRRSAFAGVIVGEFVLIGGAAALAP